MIAATSKPLTITKRLLFGPGPSMVDPRAAEAMHLPVLGIRDPQFLEIMAEIREGLRTVFGAPNPMTFPVPSGGSGGMEAAIANFVRPGSKFAVFAAGHFADRIAEMGKRHGANVVRYDKPWGEVFQEAEASAFLAREKPAAVAYVQAETSTGAYQSGAALAKTARELGALVIADTVTSLGAMPVEMEKVGIDVAFSCSQKGLSCPAGLAPISISLRAWDVLAARPEPMDTWYFDLRLMAKYFEPPHIYQHTPSPPLYYALHQALAAIAEEGLTERWNRHRRAAERLEPGLRRLGFTYLVSDPGDRLWHLAVVKPPDGLDEAALRNRLLERYDIEIAGGLGQLAGKVLRIGTMGPLATDGQVDFLLEALAATV